MRPGIQNLMLPLNIGTNMEFDKKVACGNFVKRQTEDSGYSHFAGSWEELERRTTYFMERRYRITPGYRDGVILVDVYEAPPSEQFYSAVVTIDSKTKLNACYAARREKESPFIRISAKANKQVANHASVVLYRHDVLVENNERETNAEWEIVAIKARVDEEEEPMDPYTMARNYLHLEGGTKGEFTAEQFAKSIVYWNNHCMTAGKPKWHRFLKKFFAQVMADIKEGAYQIWQNLLSR